MKTRIITIALLAFGVTLFAQKKEIKKAEKENESGNYTAALTLLNSVEANLAEEDDDLKTKFYVAKGNALFGDGTDKDKATLKKATEAFTMASKLDDTSVEASDGLINVKNAVLTKGIDAYNAKDFGTAMVQFESAYDLSPADTIYLYNAANMALSAQDYDSALKYYIKLSDVNYDGKEEEFVAINKETGEEELFGSKQERDLAVKAGEYIKPQNRMSESKRGEVAKNIALIYISQDKNEEALAAMDAAKRENPDDASLLESEADMYYRMGNMAKYKELMEQVVAGDPNNATLYYNLGVSTAQLGDNDGALTYYKKALELNPDMKNAQINIAAILLSNEAPIVEEMNSLGTSSKDYKRYDELVEKRATIYREAIPYLEKALKIDSKNVEAVRTMMNIYSQLDDEAKVKEMKARLSELEGN